MSAAEPDAQVTRALHAMFDRQWEESARLFPEFATYRGDHRYGDRLSDASPEGLAARDEWTARNLAEARAVARDKLGATDRVSLDMFIANQQRFVDQQAFPGWRTMSLSALGGAQSQFANLLSISPLSRREWVEQMLARMAVYPKRMDQEIANLRRGLATGWVPPRDVLVRVLAQIDAQLPVDVEADPHYAPFKRLPASLPAADRGELQAAARVAITQHVRPALRRLRDFVADEYLPRAPVDGALKNYPDGVRVYDMLLRQQTTTDLGAQQIHDIGQRELQRLRGEMEAAMAQTGFRGGFDAFIRFLNTDPQFFHTSPEALLAGYRDIAKRIDAELPLLFVELPRAPYGVQPMPAHMGPNRAEYYSGPALDGTRAGTFYANTMGWRTKPTWGMETLVAHEAVPGHHLQIARATELRGLPNFRRSGFGYTAFTEGWALYAETLGSELGLYTEPTSRFGHLQWQAFRAARLVVDTGYHALGWSRQRCIDFMVERTGVDRDFVSAEIDRYTSQPGQALAYMIGKLKFDELRDRAKVRLGARFDIRKFHNAVLDQGALPLSTLERVVDEWIAAQAGG
ncbi:MAG: DUF885 domain-containing protein [Rubrivivax sp.]|nr:DUF885 domain-containing protein [Rubrivivax sp.]